jgi:hypothetical protein
MRHSAGGTFQPHHSPYFGSEGGLEPEPVLAQMRRKAEAAAQRQRPPEARPSAPAAGRE